MPTRTRTLVLAAVAALVAGACQAKRTLVVTSEPPGAEVRLDGQHIGTTPVEEEFMHYGVRRVTLYKDGYLTHSEVIDLRPPWYGRFPIDLFSEMLIPVGWRDRNEVHAKLELGQGVIQAADLESVLERSEELRRAGPEGPLGAPKKPEPVEEQDEGAGGS